MITKVTEDGPAAKSDIKAGDVIVAVNGEAVGDYVTLPARSRSCSPTVTSSCR